MFDISGRVALVTGSSRGIGYALAAGLLRAGASVLVNGRDAQRVDAACASLSALGVVLPAPFDVTSAASVVDGIAAAEQAAGPIDILVNNAGMQLRAPFESFPESGWHELIATNVTSAFLVGREVAKGMISRGGGKIVNIASLQSAVARPSIAPYAASKGAILMLTKGMCADLAPHGITVNALGPGYIVTELTRALHEDESFDAWVRGRTPAGRWGSVEDLVGPLIFLVSPASNFVNGHILYADGGMLAVL